MLSIITHTRHERPELLERCKDSVKKALPPYASHEIIECYGDHSQARYDATQISEYFGFVDDDDYISENSIKLCMAALESSGADIAFTDEVIVDLDGNVLCPSSPAIKTYVGASMHPRTIHHLVIARRSAIDPAIIQLDKKFTVGMDWFICASAALKNNNAIHVPIDGYFWSKHSLPHSQQHSEVQGKAYERHMRSMGQCIREIWTPKMGKIPDYIVPSTVI